MRVIIAGSRSISDIREVNKAMEECGFAASEILSGCARGVDALGIRWATEHNVPVKRYPARWDDVRNVPKSSIRYHSNGTPYNVRAGYERNTHMALNADALVLVWDGHSGGSAHMLKEAQKYNLQVYQHILGAHP